MKAQDVMVSPVVTLKVTDTVRQAAALFLTKRISGAPVVDDRKAVVGVVSEGDLLHRVEAGTVRQRSWWLRPFVSSENLAADYVRSHSLRIADLMTRNVISAAPDTPLADIARLMETHGIKRVPILQDGRLVGLVTRANLIQAVASAPAAHTLSVPDEAIRSEFLRRLRKEEWASNALLNATVSNGVLDLWGGVDSASQRDAARVLAESVPGVRGVTDNTTIRPILPGI